jgi:hypothetical protein
MTGDRPLQRAEIVSAPRGRSQAHRVFRALLLIWIVAYPVVVCAASLVGAGQGRDPGSMAVVTIVVIGLALLIPWLIGLVALGLLTLFKE